MGFCVEPPTPSKLERTAPTLRKWRNSIIWIPWNSLIPWVSSLQKAFVLRNAQVPAVNASWQRFAQMLSSTGDAYFPILLRWRCCAWYDVTKGLIEFLLLHARRCPYYRIGDESVYGSLPGVSKWNTSYYDELGSTSSTGCGNLASVSTYKDKFWEILLLGCGALQKSKSP